MLSHEAKAAIPELIELLKDKDWQVQQAAAEALGNMGSDAKAAIPALTELLKDSHEWVRKSANKALQKIKSDEEPTIPTAPSTSGTILIQLVSIRSYTCQQETQKTASRHSLYFPRF